MVKQVQRSAGRTKVAGEKDALHSRRNPNDFEVCGSSEFSLSIRDIVLKSMDQYHDIEFAEVEFQPRGVRQAYPGIHAIDDEDIELDRMAHSKRSSMGRLVRSSRLAGGSTNFRKLRSEADTSEQEGGTERLVRSRSGATTKLRTVEEADEASDLEAQSNSIRAREKEFV